MNHFHAFLWGLAGAAALETLGRPPSAKVVFPVIGRLPTLAMGDASKPGIVENLLGGGGLLSGLTGGAPAPAPGA